MNNHLNEITPDVKEALMRYINHGIKPGGFLCAVLANDLKEAIMRADLINSANLKTIVGWVYWNIPSIAWGSYQAIDNWKGAVRECVGE